MKYIHRFKKERVLKILGGHKAAAKYFGISSQAISMWANEADIPRIHQLALVINMPKDFPKA
jgi:hypothetical protein